MNGTSLKTASVASVNAASAYRLDRNGRGGALRELIKLHRRELFGKTFDHPARLDIAVTPHE